MSDRANKVKFQKFHGTGNDFLIIQASVKFNPDARTVSKLCSRKRGVGADGLIITQKKDKKGIAPFIFFNSDGSKADFCGNGLRCAALFHYLRFGSKVISFKTGAGIYRARIISDGMVSVEIPVASAPKEIVLEDGTKAFFCKIGVPHAVIPVKHLSSINVKKIGSEIRHSKIFAPEGTNVDFVEILSTDKIAIRTYERGVEDETESCGSGACAAAFCVAEFSKSSKKISVFFLSDDHLLVEFPGWCNGPSKSKKIILTGPAEMSFSGETYI